MKDYYCISQLQTVEGTYKLWESEKYGDEVPAVVTLNGVSIGQTYDSLEEYVKCFRAVENFNVFNL